jgi:hypothetical protein
MNATRQTLCRWILAGLIERGCDPATARIPERVPRIRFLTDAEVATFRPPPWSVVRVSNIVPFPRQRRSRVRIRPLPFPG